MAGKKNQSRPVCQTQAQLAVVLGVSESMIRIFLTQGMPRLADTGFDIPDCVAWYIKEKTAAGTAERKKLAEAIDKEKASELKELQIREKKGELIHVEKVVQFVSQDYAQVKRCLQGLSASIAPSLAPEFRDLVTREIDNKVRLKLHELANREEEFVNDHEVDGRAES